MKTKLDITVIGGKEEIKELLIVLSKIEWLGRIGAGRKIPIVVDGDGSADLKFYIKNIPPSEDGKPVDSKWIEDCTSILELVELDPDKLKKVGDGDDFEEQYIGE